jgi:PQQ-dependent catabolism-associated CXXCW motif protein
LKRALLALALMAGEAAAPEPPTFRLDNYNAPVPETLSGATVLHTQALISFIAAEHPVLIDVLPAPRRPAGMAPTALWLPLPHEDIPHSIWLPDTGRGEISPALEATFAEKLKSLTGSDPNRAVVFYCRANCWMSWNAAKRAVQLGYHHVVWYPDGVEGWQKSGHPLAPNTPP